ncbi:MAG: choice-of-anchor J domain-containing protein, partial [Bacteroidales bacterium]|nr:choice-of-anchor J domain-containing protein [Bacteroidales bacterium]
WSFAGGIPSSSTEQNPIVTYPDQGIYSVSLTVTVSSGNDQIIKNSIIQITDTDSGEMAPFTEGFEYSSFPVHPDDNNKDWIIESEGAYTWERTTWASASGNASIKINNFGNDNGTINSLFSPNIIIDGIQDTAINFKIAYAKKTSSSNDNLRVYVSYDCGKDWKFRYGKSGNFLATNGGEIVSGTFIPNAAQWRQETATLNSLYADSSHIRIKFQCTGGGGNYLYIDDINISGNTAIDDLINNAKSKNLHIYPNPFNPDIIPAKISYNLFEKSNVTITVSNIFGKVIGIFNKEQIKGHYDLNLSDIVSSRLLGINSGVYFIKLTTDNYSVTRKVVCIK